METGRLLKKTTRLVVLVCGFCLSFGLVAWIAHRASKGHSDVDGYPKQEAALSAVKHPRMAFVSYPTKMNSRTSDRFEEVVLLDQDGDSRFFYRDLVADRASCIIFFYTRCTGSCPTTIQTIKRIKKELDVIFDEDELKFIALTLEPGVDTPEQLRRYMQDSGVVDDPELSEWVFATADFEALERLRYSLGVYDLDPEIDADKTEHASLLTFGNDRTDRWAALPADMDFQQLLTAMRRVMGNDTRQSFGDFSSE